MSRLYKRGCSVTLITPSTLPNAFFDRQGGKDNAVVITDMRVQFKLEKSTKKQPNKGTVTIYNLAEMTRVLCEKKPLQVWLNAGYDGVLHRLFFGDVRFAWSALQKPEWTTTIQLGDGDRAYRGARMNKTYAGGTPVLQAAKDVAGSMGLTIGASDLQKLGGLQQQMTSSRALQGASRDQLDAILAPYGVDWSIQDGRLQILGDGDVNPGEALVISQDTGMIDTPEWTTPTTENKPRQLKVKTLLYPQCNPGDLIQVSARSINKQLFKITKVMHNGDTHGKNWTTELEAAPYSSTSVQ